MRFFFCLLWKQKGLLIRLDTEESAPGRLAPSLRSLVPTSAPLPRNTATDHFSFSAHEGVSLQSGMKFALTENHLGIFLGLHISVETLSHLTIYCQVKAKQ